MPGGDASAPPPSNTLVLLPGLDGTEAFLRPLARCLAPTLHTVTLSYPQAGPSDYTTLLALVRQQTADLSSYYLLGSSFGGPLAVMLAAAEPGKVRGLILAASFLRSPKPWLSRVGFVITGPLVWLLRTARRLPIWLGRDRQDPLRVAKVETWRQVSAFALARRARAALAVDVRAALTSLQLPVLCLSFDQDRLVPESALDDILAAAPQASHRKLLGKHLALVSDPEPAAALVRDFLAGRLVRA